MVILKAENISKQYRLGLVGTGTISHDLNRWWHRVRGKEDPYLKVGSVNDRSTKADSDYVWALQDINFEVQQGEVLGIIGKNGAGKSTLLKILSRVTSPTTGEIKTKGRIASLLEVGTGFHPELTGRENIYLNGAILGMTKAEIREKEAEIIAFSGCERYVDTPVKRYSSGMRVRLAFAVAAFLEPDILVVDEVLAVGDAEFQKKAVGKMQDISKGNGRTVLFVSHNMATIKTLCSRVIVIDNGLITYDGKVGEGVDRYLTSGRNKKTESLLHRTDRQGNQKLKVKRVYFQNERNEVVDDIISTELLKVRIEVEKYSELNYNRLFLAVNFIDSNLNFVLSYTSDEMGVNLKELELYNIIELEIPKLYLRGGTYTLRVLITENDTTKANFVDCLENAASINVLSGDLWKTGKLNRKTSTAIFPGKLQVINEK
ncbi:ABC transporter ATP-binding protein [Hanstruepera neustonica]|uniref:ABC transporter ATP-binding protein n=1 Tax=Hanstruepera neustonica TaxID=1445657 RepID=A0A2K1DVR3_9FLAO|nr:ABC transporter ATP-binding protein [Hanstruepera neustonica]PNQ72112.1 ABC transporter ATP-binding protein [Hanstruepera neustonica]